MRSARCRAKNKGANGSGESPRAGWVTPPSGGLICALRAVTGGAAADCHRTNGHTAGHRFGVRQQQRRQPRAGWVTPPSGSLVRALRAVTGGAAADCHRTNGHTAGHRFGVRQQQRRQPRAG
ncbi:hypothetical protein GCM10012280_33470 [Wenjunlia tyrosinilytica]|uniref:Uncharacterized protein n=1 Tax=Wenjunlia tyrosinilytica TaxID=1544741 RepID=A0A918DZF7_9ACTN|nr:hypothetical protein GCM10012280_33470 [Wenjunlia tyrosinilytica]